MDQFLYGFEKQALSGLQKGLIGGGAGSILGAIIGAALPEEEDFDKRVPASERVKGGLIGGLLGAGIGSGIGYGAHKMFRDAPLLEKSIAPVVSKPSVVPPMPKKGPIKRGLTEKARMAIDDFNDVTSSWERSANQFVDLKTKLRGVKPTADDLAELDLLKNDLAGAAGKAQQLIPDIYEASMSMGRVSSEQSREMMDTAAEAMELAKKVAR